MTKRKMRGYQQGTDEVISNEPMVTRREMRRHQPMPMRNEIKQMEYLNPVPGPGKSGNPAPADNARSAGGVNEAEVKRLKAVIASRKSTPGEKELARNKLKKMGVM